MTTPIQWRQGLTLPLDPDADRLYTVDCTEWFGADAVIDTFSVTPETGITVGYTAVDGLLIGFKVSGLAAGAKVGVTVRVTTAGVVPETDERTIYFEGRER
jgi:hypothetical protein